MDLKEEATIGGDPLSHWYYISKGRALQSFLDGETVDSLLDVGAGSGVFSKMLKSAGFCDRAVCVDPNYTDTWISEHQEADISYVRDVATVDAPLVIMIDVIEHVDDDVALIRDYVEKAAPGTRFLISVPAFQFLWSDHDVFLEHRRRYTKDTLQTSIMAAGLRPLRQQYFFGLLFPAVAAMRWANNLSSRPGQPHASALKPAPTWLNRLMVGIHDVERAILMPVNNFMGVTAIALAVKD